MELGTGLEQDFERNIIKQDKNSKTGSRSVRIILMKNLIFLIDSYCNSLAMLIVFMVIH